jgi:putative endonuclease
MASHVRENAISPWICAEQSLLCCLTARDDAIVVGAVHYVYILRCADNSLYTGETSDLDHRLAKHNEGTACTFTRARRPVVLVYSETHATREAARARERQLKRWTRAKKDALIAGDRALLKRL